MPCISNIIYTSPPSLSNFFFPPQLSLEILEVLAFNCIYTHKPMHRVHLVLLIYGVLRAGLLGMEVLSSSSLLTPYTSPSEMESAHAVHTNCREYWRWLYIFWNASVWETCLLSIIHFLNTLSQNGFINNYFSQFVFSSVQLWKVKTFIIIKS